jgi:hypothetical protein
VHEGARREGEREREEDRLLVLLLDVSRAIRIFMAVRFSPSLGRLLPRASSETSVLKLECSVHQLDRTRGRLSSRVNTSLATIIDE